MKKLFAVFAVLLVMCGACYAAEYSLKMGITPNNTSNEYKAAEFFAKEVNEKSGGKIEIALFPNAQLGDDRAMIEQLGAGALDFGFCDMVRVGTFVPEAQVFGLPYIIADFGHMKKAFATPYGEKVRDSARKAMNLEILAQAYNGTRQTSSNKAINSLEDMKGLKIRVPKAEPNMKYAELSGASPTPMAFAEVYLALKTNAVDAQENPMSAIRAQKFYEVQPFLALTNHILNDQLYLVGEPAWTSLPEDLKKIVSDAAAAAADYHTKLFMEEEQGLIDFFKSQGVTVTTPDIEPFRAAMKPYYDEIIAVLGDSAKEGIEQIQKAK